MRKKQLSDERIDELMTVYDVEVAGTLANELNREFKTLSNLLYEPQFISINHIAYFETMLYYFIHFPGFSEFKGVFSRLYYGIEGELWIAPETVNFSEYTLDPDITLDMIPEEIKIQLKPIDREDVLEIAENLKDVLMELSIKFDNNVYWWLEDDGLEPKDMEEKYGLECFEYVLEGAFNSYFDRFGEFIVPRDWTMLEYLCYCFANENPDNYKQLEDMYLKTVEEVDKREEEYNKRFLEWEDSFRERFCYYPELPETPQEIRLKEEVRKAHYDYLRNHVFNCIEA